MTDLALSAVAARRPRSMPAWKISFYRQCRLWHGWLSAFAFIALMFFSGTGLLLNHPEWFAGSAVRNEESKAQLNAADIRLALGTPQPPARLGEILLERKLVGGVYASGEIDDGTAFLRFEGVTGNSSVTLDLKSGAAEIARQKASAMTVLNDLHRGKNAGQAWKWLIDVSAALFLILSLVGYVLFFSMRYRLSLALGLTAASILALFGLFLLFVP